MKEKVVSPCERDRWDVVVGVLAFALSLFVIILAFASYSGWPPAQYTVDM